MKNTEHDASAREMASYPDTLTPLEVLLIGNPTRPDGELYDAFQQALARADAIERGYVRTELDYS